MKLLLIMSALLGLSIAHTYKSGECPPLEPMQGFDMRKFLGIWYAVQKTSTASECVIYNFTQEEPGIYKIQQISQDYLLGIAPVSHRYSYTGELEVKDNDISSKMTVKFPLNVLPGNVFFKVFMTDYENYAGIFTCQKLPVGAHRQSATILSRNKDIDRAYVDKVRNRLQSAGINIFDLSIINQYNCPKLQDDARINIEIDPETFSSQNIGSWVRKAGTKLGDGVEWTVDKTKKIYSSIRGDSSSNRDSERISRLSEESTEKPIWFP